MQTELNYDTVFDAQQHFRLLLDSMSRPGKINTFPVTDIAPPEGFNQAAALTGFALLNADVTYNVIGENAADAGTYLLVNTAAQSAEIAVADYIFLPEDHNGKGLDAARTGTPVYPEDSATLIAAANRVSNLYEDGSIEILLKGPGVDGEATVFVSGLNPELLDFVKEQNSEYPLGIDLIIADRHNNILCIPRSNKFTYQAAGAINLIN